MHVLAIRNGADRYVVPLESVRAVVRLRGLRPLPGAAGALVGVLDVQEAAVAVHESRPGHDHPTGDALVLAAGWPGQAVAIACDEVLGLLDADPADEGAGISGLPTYVIALLRVEGAFVPLVDPLALAAANRAAAATAQT